MNVDEVQRRLWEQSQAHKQNRESGTPLFPTNPYGGRVRCLMDLMHNPTWIRAACDRVMKRSRGKAPGVDGMTVKRFTQNLAYSRYLLHWEIRESMLEEDVEVVLQRAREKFPGAKPRVITDNGPQFIAKDFKQFIRISGMTHVRTSPYYPQSNGKLERYHRTIKADCIRPGTPLTLEDARRIVSQFVCNYNEVRLHSALGYVTPATKLAGREKELFALRDAKLEAARQRRQQVRAETVRHAQQERAKSACYTENAWSEDRALLGSNPSAEPGPKTKSEAAQVAACLP